MHHTIQMKDFREPIGLDNRQIDSRDGKTLDIVKERQLLGRLRRASKKEY